MFGMQCGRTRCDRRYRCPSIFGCSDKIVRIVIVINALLNLLMLSCWALSLTQRSRRGAIQCHSEI